MKLRRVKVQNVRSFLEAEELVLPGDISIIIGPNGGGKTNLLDAAVLALRAFLLKSWVPRHSPAQDWPERYEWANNDAINVGLLERHSANPNGEQVIELDIEVTGADIDGMRRTKADVIALQASAKTRYTWFPTEAAEWNVDTIKQGETHSFRIVNGSLQPWDSTSTGVFKNYLETYEVHSRVRAEFERSPLSTPMISLPVTRSAGDVSASISLASFNEHDSKRNVDAASSRTSGSVSSLAIGRLATRFRELLENDDGHARSAFRDDPSIEGFSRSLKSLGYGWELQCTNPLRNQYDLRLNKQGSSFRVGAASSGEKELLTYLFAVYALNVRDALIVVDEPELHLHPRWQRTLLSLFETLAQDTGNQFLMATHSPVFVSPSSIQYVSRVYSEDQRSRIVRLGDSGLPEPKHLFGIVNSQNNERVFFADLVILVEGISDRIFFERVLRHFEVFNETGRVYEVVSVGGKTLFEQYEKLLRACKVPYMVIADLDYVRELGGGSIKHLFTPSSQAVKRTLDDPSSLDAAAICDALDEFVANGATDKLKEVWQYVRNRRSVLRSDLSLGETAELESFISEQQREHNRFILHRGDLEAYLPDGHAKKDLQKLIRLVSQDDFWATLPADGKSELEAVAKAINQA